MIIAEYLIQSILKHYHCLALTWRNSHEYALILHYQRFSTDVDLVLVYLEQFFADVVAKDVLSD